jgi:hypothetical protein
MRAVLSGSRRICGSRESGGRDAPGREGGPANSPHRGPAALRFVVLRDGGARRR